MDDDHLRFGGMLGVAVRLQQKESLLGVEEGEMEWLVGRVLKCLKDEK